MKVEERGRHVSEAVKANPEMLVPWYLILSFLYYQADIALVPDAVYDAICEELAWTTRPLKHRHARLINREALFAGTGFYLSYRDYPGIVIGAASQLAKADGHWSPPGAAADDASNNYGY